MSDPQATPQPESAAMQADMMSALFAQMVLQQSNLAMMLLGKAPHPESGQSMRDLDGAKLFIDQLEMLAVKTKGNLSKEESALLKQSLMGLRMAFVECVNAAPETEKPRTDSTATAAAPAGAAPGAAEQEETRKKFTKKY